MYVIHIFLRKIMYLFFYQIIKNNVTLIITLKHHIKTQTSFTKHR